MDTSQRRTQGTHQGSVSERGRGQSGLGRVGDPRGNDKGNSGSEKTLVGLFISPNFTNPGKPSKEHCSSVMLSIFPNTTPNVSPVKAFGEPWAPMVRYRLEGALERF